MMMCNCVMNAKIPESFFEAKSNARQVLSSRFRYLVSQMQMPEVDMIDYNQLYDTAKCMRLIQETWDKTTPDGELLKVPFSLVISRQYGSKDKIPEVLEDGAMDSFDRTAILVEPVVSFWVQQNPEEDDMVHLLCYCTVTDRINNPHIDTRYIENDEQPVGKRGTFIIPAVGAQALCTDIARFLRGRLPGDDVVMADGTISLIIDHMLDSLEDRKTLIKESCTETTYPTHSMAQIGTTTFCLAQKLDKEDGFDIYWDVTELNNPETEYQLMVYTTPSVVMLELIPTTTQTVFANGKLDNLSDVIAEWLLSRGYDMSYSAIATITDVIITQQVTAEREATEHDLVRGGSKLVYLYTPNRNSANLTWLASMTRPITSDSLYHGLVRFQIDWATVQESDDVSYRFSIERLGGVYPIVGHGFNNEFYRNQDLAFTAGDYTIPERNRSRGDTEMGGNAG